MKNAIHDFFNRIWYGESSFVARLLSPLALITQRYTQRKRQRYFEGQSACYRAPVPVIVVGNITVGGTGKTPLVVWLIQQLQAQGYRPGVVTRGYGGQPPHYPYLIQAGDSAVITGDEPLMLQRRTGVPVIVDPQRARAAQALLAQTDCNVIISDDGLQHYPLARTFEIVVVDGTRGLGNGKLLPAGPLREKAQRLAAINALVINGESRHPSLQQTESTQHYTMRIVPGQFHTLQGQRQVSVEALPQLKQWTAVAGIGNPQRFFTTLDQLGVSYSPRPFPDHHHYTLADFAAIPADTLITTEKDAVKLQALGVQGWYLPVDAQLQPGLIDDILAALKRFQSDSKHLY